LRRHRDDVNAHRRRRQLGVALSLTLLASLILAPTALAGFITPKSGGSPNANGIASLYKVILVVAVIVFLIVEGALVYSVYRFRARKGAVAAQIHGDTRLEIGWTAAAALILVVITIVTFAELPGIVNAPDSNANAILSASTTQPTPPNGKKVSICVQGRQYIWRYSYGAGCENSAYAARLPYSYTEMIAPEGETVVLTIQSNDVIHSWWIPSLGGKVDAVPGFTTYTWFKALHPGLFHGQCAQLCGRGHAAMVATVRVVPPAQYAAWLARQAQLIRAANSQVTQLRQSLTQSGNL